jgi:hypothetical protein
MNPHLLENLKSYRYKFVRHTANRGNTYTILIVNNEEKTPLGGSKRSWEGNIETDLKERI